jgi:putative acetyltransferase
MTSVSIRNARPDDAESARAVHTAAFGNHAEADRVDRLIADGQAAISLVAVADGQIVAHILFSPLEVTGTIEPVRALSLAPLAVLPAWQRRGTGSRLVREGIRSAEQIGIDAIIVVGHPEYYRRFGFSAGLAARLQSPYSGPAFMAIELTPGVLAAGGAVHYPEAFSHLT